MQEIPPYNLEDSLPKASRRDQRRPLMIIALIVFIDAGFMALPPHGGLVFFLTEISVFTPILLCAFYVVHLIEARTRRVRLQMVPLIVKDPGARFETVLLKGMTTRQLKWFAKINVAIRSASSANGKIRQVVCSYQIEREMTARIYFPPRRPFGLLWFVVPEEHFSKKGKAA